MAHVDAVIVALSSFAPQHDGKDVARLYDILEGIESMADRERAIQPILALLERFPDADVGAPGPLVHGLEAMDRYQPLLRESLHRRPTAVTVEMVNRILNSSLTKPDRQSWLAELDAAAAHPNAPAAARQAAAHYIAYQQSRTGAAQQRGHIE